MVALPSEGRAGKRRGAPGAPRSAGNGPGRRAWERREALRSAQFRRPEKKKRAKVS